MILIGTMLVFSAFPIANLILGLSTKDYGLWYHVGLAVRQGMDIYPRPESGRLFPFMYPPSAAAMLACMSMLGQTGLLLALVLVNSAAWLACIKLSSWLAFDPGTHRHPLVLTIPSFAVIVLIYNIYLLGQPNLLLLALLLAARSLVSGAGETSRLEPLWLRLRQSSVPILALDPALPPDVDASATTIAVLGAWLLIAPLPFRTPAQAVDDVRVWSQGMIFTYNSYGIAQRPIRSYSYKNQSIMALTPIAFFATCRPTVKRFCRKGRADQGVARPSKGLRRVDPTTDLLFLLKPHGPHLASSAEQTNKNEDQGASSSAVNGAESARSAPRWNGGYNSARPIHPAPPGE